MKFSGVYFAVILNFGIFSSTRGIVADLDMGKHDAEIHRRGLVSKVWPFFASDSVTVPNRKPIPGKPPKPLTGAQPIASWNDDKAGWSSIGWVNMQSVCQSTVLATSYELTKTTITATEIETKTEYYTTTETEYEFETGVPASPETITITSTTCNMLPPPPPGVWGWTPHSSTVFTTTTETHTATSTVEITSTAISYETSIFSSTETTTSTSVVYDIITATTFITSSIQPSTPSYMDTGVSYIVCRDGKCSTGTEDWSDETPPPTIVLEPSVAVDQTTSTITSTLTETPVLTVRVPIQTTITTSLEISTETVFVPFSTTPPITVTEVIATSLNTTVATVTSTLLTNSPTCTFTKYRYLSTVTVPSKTITASYCGHPCGFPDKCSKVCYPKIITTTFDITSTSVAAAIQPITLTYSALETKTSYNIEDSTLLTTETVELIGTATTTTLTSTETLPPEISTQTTEVTLTSYPLTITTTENLCTSTVFETCTTTVTASPTYVTLLDTQVVGVCGTVFSETTSFTAPPVPTVTSYVQGGINLLTDTSTITIVTDSKAVTTTITGSATTVASGETTITPTRTIFNVETAIITTTAVVNTTQIKRRTLMVEEYTTDVEGTTESYVVAPIVTELAIVEMTPSPSMVTATSLIMGWSTTSSSSASGWKHPSPSKHVEIVG